MRKASIWVLLIIMVILCGCSGKNDESKETKWDKIPTVMIDGKLYYDTGKESTGVKENTQTDGEITSTVDGSEMPAEDNQSNFGTGFEYIYGTDDTIEIFMNNKWIIFEHRQGEENQVQFGDKMIDASSLSHETLKWLNWYNSLPQTEQLKINSIPHDLYDKLNYAQAEDANAKT